MKKKIKYIIIILLLIIVAIVTIILMNNKKQKDNNIQVTAKVNNTDENALVIEIDKKQINPTEQNEVQNQENENKTEEPKEELVKDAATLTQEIYNMNSTIGTLYIPKTGLKTEIFSNVVVTQMEKMPCFLYTTGGLNKTGVTLFVGHNRRNGKLFSNNKKLVEGDEFYFTDYEGNEVKYTIYSKFTTTEDDTSFLNNNVETPTIALSCCTDANDENRIIILGRAD